MSIEAFIKTCGIGLTGGIATGKSTVAKIIRDAGFPVYDADRFARDVVAPGTPGLTSLVALVGDDFLTAEGFLNRKALAQKIFADAALKQQVESLLHPLIYERLAAAITADQLMEKKAVWFYEAALLYETGNADRFSAVWATFCPEDEQIRRLMQRDKCSADEARAMLTQQLSPTEKARRADLVINTDIPEHHLKLKVASVLENLDTTRS